MKRHKKTAEPQARGNTNAVQKALFAVRFLLAAGLVFIRDGFLGGIVFLGLFGNFLVQFFFAFFQSGHAELKFLFRFFAPSREVFPRRKWPRRSTRLKTIPKNLKTYLSPLIFLLHAMQHFRRIILAVIGFGRAGNFIICLSQNLRVKFSLYDIFNLGKSNQRFIR